MVDGRVGRIIGFVALVASCTSEPAPPAPTPASLGATVATTPAADANPSCAEGCRAASRCGIGATTCMTDCNANSVVRACLAQAKTDCNAAALCTFKAVCQGNAPHGTGSCADALRCQVTGCAAGDFACGCDCSADLAPSKALFLMRVDACAVNCKFDNACMLRSCKMAGDACAMR